MNIGEGDENWPDIIKALGEVGYDGWATAEVKTGDEDWPEIRKALGEIGYDGWATAEVAGGGENELRDVAERMDRVLGL